MTDPTPDIVRPPHAARRHVQEPSPDAEPADPPTCGFTVTDADGNEEPCDRPVTGWRWYQGHGHEDALDVACELHSNEGGRRLHAAEAEVERLDSIITGVATGDGHSCQIGLAKIVQCDDRGVTDAEARAERAESNARGKQAVIEAQRATLDRVRVRLGRLLELIEEECSEDADEPVCHDHDRTDDGECALAADLRAVLDAPQPEAGGDDE